MKTFSLCVILVAVAAGMAWKRHSQVAELRRQNGELQQNVAEIRRIRNESAAFDSAAIDRNELQQLRADWLELMRLRAEVARLRQANQAKLPEIRQEIESTQDQTAQAQQRGERLVADRAAQQISRLTGSTLSSLAYAILTVARANGGKLPGSFAEMEAMADAVARKDTREHLSHVMSETNSLPTREAELTGSTFRVSARSFEFMPASRPSSMAEPPALLLREILPRRLPDGRWARYYAFNNARIEEVALPDGTFSEWEEQQNRPQPSANP